MVTATTVQPRQLHLDRTDMIALITDNASLPDDYDMEVLVSACSDLHVAVEVRTWDDPTVNWSRFAAVVLRSPWSYTTRLAAFLSWCQEVTQVSRLLNPLDVIRWSLDKRYLADLCHHGVPTVPTLFIAPNDPRPGHSLDQFVQKHPDAPDIVIKPSVGAYSRGVRRFRRDDPSAAVKHISDLHGQNHHVLAQPYLSAIDDNGETDVIFFNGHFSHAIRKAPLLGRDGTVGEPTQDVRQARTPKPDDLAVAEQALHAANTHLGRTEPLLYARIDLIHDQERRPVVLELELCEPSLSLAFSEGSAQRFAQAINQVIKAGV